ncbi:MAG: hypothetical protein R3E64_05105 [Halioglobus sp.]
MGRSSEWRIIEIKEDAYKQNSVYRPWVEIAWADSISQTQKTSSRVDASISPSSSDLKSPPSSAVG